MSNRARAVLYSLFFLALLAYVLVRVVRDGARPGCGAYIFLFLFGSAAFTSVLRARAESGK